MVEQTIALAQLLAKMANDPEFVRQYNVITKCIHDTLKDGHKVFICGNGGSHAIALHIASEFTGRFKDNKRALPVMALGEASHTTCVGNDYGFEKIFSRQLEAFANKDDLIIVMSTSGWSDNIIDVIELSEKNKIKSIAFLGKNGGGLELRKSGTHRLIIPSDDTARIQEAHLFLLHSMTEEVLKQL